MKFNDVKKIIISKVKNFITNNKGGDMGAGTAMTIIAIVVLGGLFLNKSYDFFDLTFLPEWFNSFMNMFNKGK